MASLFLLFVASLTLVSSQKLPDDHCRLFPRPSPDIEETKISVEVPPTCTEGRVDWDWPQGSLVLHSSLLGKTYSLCLVGSSLTLLGALHDITDGRNVLIPMPQEDDEPACAQAVKGEVKLLVSAAETQYYWSSFNYKVVQK